MLILSALLLVTVAAAAMIPAEVEAGCRCTQTFQTDTLSADGPTCPTATATLTSDLEAEAGCDSFCDFDVTITMACTPNGGGGYWVMGYADFSCELCIL